jgi:amino acid transporter
MAACAIFYAFAIAYIAHRGVNSSTGVNLAINGIQVFALLVFAVLALQYRANHPAGSVAFQFDSTSGEAYTYEFATTPVVTNGTSVDTIVRDSSGVPVPKKDAAGNIVPFHINYNETDASGNFQAHPSAASVISPHHFSWMFIQATVAILILVGFESVTAMGGEAKNAKRDIPIAVITSLLVQGAVFYCFEYFAANYFLSSGYPMASAQASGAPIGDMMVVVGDALFGQGHGRTFMLCEAFTVFLALIGTTLS